jgi:hypothetical protein
LKLAVLIEKVGDDLKVREHCLANGDGVHAGSVLRVVAVGPNVKLTGVRQRAATGPE